MARSPKQIANTARIVAVAAIAKEFRKSAIIKKIKQIAKNKGMVYTGELSDTGLLRDIKTDNDWLTQKNAVQVQVGPFKGGVPSYMRIVVSIDYSVKKKYYYLTKFSDNKKWFPRVDAIENWVRAKGIESDPRKVKSVAWAISKNMAKRGIRKTNIANPLFYQRTGVDATVNRGIAKAAERMGELYGVLVVEAVDRTFTNLNL